MKEIEYDDMLVTAEMTQSQIEKYLKTFSQLKQAKPMTDFEFMQEHLIKNLGAGPEQGQTQLKMPEAAIYFVNKHFQNVLNAHKDVCVMI